MVILCLEIAMRQSTKSLENPGYMVTYHPIPEGYSQAEWHHMVSCYHTAKGRVVKSILFAAEFHDDGPYPLKSRVKTKGLEATWR